VGNVYGLIERGQLAVVCVGRRKGYRIDGRDLEAFIDHRRVLLREPTADRRAVPSPRLKHLEL
jgi:hypothetical protein